MSDSEPSRERHFDTRIWTGDSAVQTTTAWSFPKAFDSDLVSKGQEQLNNGEYAAAIETFQRALLVDRSNKAAKTGLNHAEKAKKAEGNTMPSRNIGEHSADTKQRASELATKAQEQLDSGQYATAVGTFQAAVQADGSNPMAKAGLRAAQKAKETEDVILLRRQ